MKKYYLFASLLCFCFTITAQSAKKNNVKLKATQISLLNKQDSLLLVEKQAIKSVDSLEMLINLTMTGIRSESNTFQESISKLRADTRILERLTGVSEEENIIKKLNPSQPAALESITQTNLQIKKLNDLISNFEQLKTDFPIDQNQKLKYQNTQISADNDTISQQIRNLIMKTNHLSELVNKKGDLLSQTLQLSQEMHHFYEAVEIIEEETHQRVLTLKDDFQKKGPKGFPKAYFDEFPELFPKYNLNKTKEVLNEEAFSEIVGKSYDEVGTTQDMGYGDAMPPPPPLEVKGSNEIFDIVDEPAEYPGGREALINYLGENINYPENALKKNIQGKVYVKFVVNDQGTISNVIVVKGIPECKECEEEVIRVLKKMPKWRPARNNGKNVNSYYTLPVSFKP